MTSICLGLPILLLLPPSFPYPSHPLGDFTATRSQGLDSPPSDSLATGFPLHVAKPQTLSHKPLNFLTLFFSHIKT
jgi:hypothetical protein